MGRIFYKKGFFPVLPFLFLAWKETQVQTKEVHTARGTKREWQILKTQPRVGDLLPNTAFSQNEMVGVLLHLLSYLKGFLCNHTIFQFQGTEAVNKVLTSSKTDGKG